MIPNSATPDSTTPDSTTPDSTTPNSATPNSSCAANLKHLPLQAIVFDMDGLMLDSEVLYQRAWSQAIATLGYAVDPALYLHVVGQSTAATEMILRETCGASFPITTFQTQWIQHWRTLIQQEGVALKPGLLALLAWVEAQGLPKVVATSSDAAEAELSLTTAGIRDRFAAVITVDQVAHGKPAPDLFLAALDILNVEPPHALVLEDSNAGVAAAQAAEIPVLMVPDLQPPTAATQAYASGIFTDLHQVRVWLQQLTATPFKMEIDA